MKIERIELYNFQSAKKIAFEFSGQLNLFVGVNGSGKSTVLNALSTCLSWLVKRIERENGRGTYISDLSLRNGEDEGYLDIELSHINTSFRWFLTKTAKGKNSTLDSQFSGASLLAEKIKESYDKTGWPVVAYYPVNRVVGLVRPNIPDRESIYNLDVYENALGGKANYQSFFEWFRLQDDIQNERFTSRSKWMQQNRTWIKQRIHSIFDSLRSIASDEEMKALIKHFEEYAVVYEEPRFLFSELAHAIDMLGLINVKYFDYDSFFHDVEYLSHKIATFSNKNRADLIEEGEFSETVKNLLDNFEQIWPLKEQFDELKLFIWEVFSFAILLALWWLSDKGKRHLENEFKMLRKGSSTGDNNSGAIAEQLSTTIQQIIKQEAQQKNNTYYDEGQELQVVASAIEKFLPEYTHLRIKRTPRPHMLIDKGDRPFNLDQLSDGEKNLIALVGDIARRLAIGNPYKKNPLEGGGIILIDELDLHLHPSWQRLVIPKLLDTFPNCQFFISTHSPQIISHVKPESVFLLEQAMEGLSYQKVNETYGMSLDRVVKLLMDDESRPESVEHDIEKLFELIERKKLEEAKKLVSTLKVDMPTDPEILRAEMFIRREAMIN